MSKVETSLDEKTQFIVDKVLAINPEKESIKANIFQIKNETHVKMTNIDVRIRELSNTLSRLEETMKTDLTNFKKILVRFRVEIDQLNSFAKEGINGSNKTGSD